ncbi:uncharacterized protein LOC108910117 [Anoplophora glabripennis]|uniref:uncharacterized protein LOC108910116 n=1 Tax=Anoplophora glabripennis TaxID=217634 RepID=UPI0008746AC3|nr:uncharacterized protein LOC108910116 [Anoplophora glabripennis]XP_018570145.1 uncharacterized protein LOC108910117 [Anoplophora glabripennis]
MYVFQFVVDVVPPKSAKMWTLIVFFVLICPKFCRGAPNILNAEPDINTIKYYIERGQEVLERTDELDENNYSLNPEDQKAIKFYYFYYYLADQPRSYYYSPTSNGGGDTIICFPNKKCIDLSDIGIYP